MLKDATRISSFCREFLQQITWFVQQINGKGKKNVSERFSSHGI